MKTASIRRAPYVGDNDSGSDGPDSMFVVDLMENGSVVETRNLPGKSRSYAVSLVENWEQGIIQLLID
tara:strand:+ start:324 stop:527 length:204 start_codon:yes stop_codon:yes gene_type:complete